MNDDDEVECVAECNYIVRRETRRTEDGAALIEEVERCTGCGRVLSRTPVAGSGATRGDCLSSRGAPE